jgi:hypothetical protein
MPGALNVTLRPEEGENFVAAESSWTSDRKQGQKRESSAGSITGNARAFVVNERKAAKGEKLIHPGALLTPESASTIDPTLTIYNPNLNRFPHSGET